jgi:hypothetical protein
VTALADRSDMTVWTGPVWLVAIVLSVAVAALVARVTRTDPPAPPVESHYLSEWVCWVARCDRTASVEVEHPVAGTMLVCDKCASDGTAHGWFTRKAVA